MRKLDSDIKGRTQSIFRWVLRTILGAKRDEMADCRRSYNEHKLYNTKHKVSDTAFQGRFFLRG
jgi:hypothetical protein